MATEPNPGKGRSWMCFESVTRLSESLEFVQHRPQPIPGWPSVGLLWNVGVPCHWEAATVYPKPQERAGLELAMRANEARKYYLMDDSIAPASVPVL